MQVPPFHVPEMGGWTGGTWDVNKDANGRDTVALAVGDSLLVGLCWGEFGGALPELPRSGKPMYLRSGDMCITGLYETNQGLIAVGGIEHMMHQPAELFALKRGEDGAWRQRLIAATEIARAERMVLDDGTLVVRDLGGILALGEGGRFTRLECR